VKERALIVLALVATILLARATESALTYSRTLGLACVFVTIMMGGLAAWGLLFLDTPRRKR